MTSKELQKRTDELVELAYRLALCARGDGNEGEDETQTKVNKLCNKISRKAMAIRVANNKAAADKIIAAKETLKKAATLEKVCAVERRLNFGNKILGT